MKKDLMLGILGMVLIFSVVLGGFSNLGETNQDFSEESLNVIEPTQLEAETIGPEPTEAESTPESNNTEATEPYAIVTSPPLESESKDVEPTLEPTPEPTPEPTKTDPIPITPQVQKNYSAPVLNAINYFKTSAEPEAMLWLDVMHRRFGINEFTNAMENFDQLLIWSPGKSYVRLFRRMADYDAQINSVELERVTNELDLITLPALHCDRLDIPSNYSTLLIDGANEGGYKLTHVLLAWIWLQDNGGEIELPEGFIDNMYHANAALINTDDIITDLEMEAAAFLCLAGQSELVDKSFIDQVIATQETDGGWGGTNKRWHTTVLGLLFLLHIEFPSDTYPPVLAPRSA